MTLPTTFEGMIESKYMKKEDVTPDKLLTIAGFTHQNVAQQGEAPEMKWVMNFHEPVKPMVMNPTNIQLLKFALMVDSPAEAVGRQIVAFNDPTVSFGGKLTGGIRLRAPRTRAAAAPVQSTVAPAPAPVVLQHVDDFKDDIPF